MNSPPQQLDGIFQFPELESTGLETAITIDAAYLQERPFLTNPSWYADLGRKTTSLTLSGIDETDAESILPLFTTLRHLSLQKITIRHTDFCGLPNKGIVSLQLVDCKITENLAIKWFKSFDKSLLSVKISRCSHAVQFKDKGSFVRLLQYLPDSVRSLSVYDPIYTSVILDKLPTRLTYLHLETPMVNDHCLIGTIARSSSKITTLILKMSEIGFSSIVDLMELEDLQHLRILNSVDCMGLSLLQSMGNLQTLDVHCYEPPEKEDQILKLNDDCLQHVFSFLATGEWLSLSKTHPSFDRVVTTSIYLREQVVVHAHGVAEMFLSKQEEMEIWRSLQRYATSMKVFDSYGSYFELPLSDFERLHTLTLNGYFSAAYIQTIPNGIKKLHIILSSAANRNRDSMELGDLFHRLGPTLTSLNLSGRFNPSALSELTNLRELKVDHLSGKEWVGILQRNKDHLERLEVVFSDTSKDYSFRLCPLKRLKVLHLKDIVSQIDLEHSDFPSLEDLKVSFHKKLDKSTKADLLCSISKFVQLKSLVVQMMSVEQLSALENLESLDMYVYVNPDDIENLLKKLPKLSKLNLWIQRLDLEFEAKLCQFLIGEKRTLRLNEVVLP